MQPVNDIPPHLLIPGVPENPPFVFPLEVRSTMMPYLRQVTGAAIWIVQQGLHLYTRKLGFWRMYEAQFHNETMLTFAANVADYAEVKMSEGKQPLQACIEAAQELYQCEMATEALKHPGFLATLTQEQVNGIRHDQRGFAAISDRVQAFQQRNPDRPQMPMYPQQQMPGMPPQMNARYNPYAGYGQPQQQMYPNQMPQQMPYPQQIAMQQQMQQQYPQQMPYPQQYPQQAYPNQMYPQQLPQHLPPGMMSPQQMQLHGYPQQMPQQYPQQQMPMVGMHNVVQPNMMAPVMPAPPMNANRNLDIASRYDSKLNAIRNQQQQPNQAPQQTQQPTAAYPNNTGYTAQPQPQQPSYNDRMARIQQDTAHVQQHFSRDATNRHTVCREYRNDAVMEDILIGNGGAHTVINERFEGQGTRGLNQHFQMSPRSVGQTPPPRPTPTHPVHHQEPPREPAVTTGADGQQYDRDGNLVLGLSKDFKPKGNGSKQNPPFAFAYDPEYYISVMVEKDGRVVEKLLDRTKENVMEYKAHETEFFFQNTNPLAKSIPVDTKKARDEFMRIVHMNDVEELLRQADEQREQHAEIGLTEEEASVEMDMSNAVHIPGYVYVPAGVTSHTALQMYADSEGAIEGIDAEGVTINFNMCEVETLPVTGDAALALKSFNKVTTIDEMHERMNIVYGILPDRMWNRINEYLTNRVNDALRACLGVRGVTIDSFAIDYPELRDYMAKQYNHEKMHNGFKLAMMRIIPSLILIDAKENAEAASVLNIKRVGESEPMIMTYGIVTNVTLLNVHSRDLPIQIRDDVGLTNQSTVPQLDDACEAIAKLIDDSTGYIKIVTIDDEELYIFKSAMVDHFVIGRNPLKVVRNWRP